MGRVAMRTHMMLLSDRGFPAFDIAELHEVTHPTVYKWMDRFDEGGPEGLFDRDREGRLHKIDDEVEGVVDELLQTAPTDEGKNTTRWTTPRIAKYLEEELGVDVHSAEVSAHETVREALKRLQYSWPLLGANSAQARLSRSRWHCWRKLWKCRSSRFFRGGFPRSSMNTGALGKGSQASYVRSIMLGASPTK